MSIRNEVFKSGVGLTISGQYTTFRVWAPNALAVGLLGDFNDWQETPLTSDGDGYWHVRLKGVRPGANYRYLVSASNGEKLLRKDPRSLQMTDSADGASVVPDFDFDWGEDNYIAPPKDKVVIYELHIGTFARADRATVWSSS